MTDAEDMVETFKKLEDMFKDEPTIVEDNSKKILFVGDVHGDILTMSYVSQKLYEFDKVVFLGDYIDRGIDDIEVSRQIAELKIENENVVLLAGNHDCESIWPRDWIGRLNEAFGADDAKKISRTYMHAFQNAPIAYLNRQYKILGVHGFIPKDKHNIQNWEKSEYAVLWNDPNVIGGKFLEEDSRSERGDKCYRIGEKTVLDFMRQNNLNKIVRSHEPRTNAKFLLEHGKVVINIGSSSYYKTRGFYVLPADKIVIAYP
ncbi:MAG: metallophosphoesterase family protein [Candidatus Nanoarchaeia archaeon]|nr:metallophosphoesterase family protein [Candidatus Nanoarchaeia archaeon]MDD5239813.1 metallophosphoesterase family protein [Candidatus Nanoarchaeia archaeon]